MKFVSAYSEERRSNATTPTGSEMEPVYGYEIDKKGLKVLKQTGEKNVYDEIQSHLEDTKIENIIQRVVAGDESMLRPDAIYTDVTDMPNNMLDAMNQVKALEATYNDLPENLKAKYPTLESYVSATGSEAWLIDNGYIQPPVEEKRITEQQLMEKATEGGTPNES